MAYFTSNTYQMKREILNFTNKISKKLSKPDRKFSADMTYGMLASGSCLLTDIVDQLHEDSSPDGASKNIFAVKSRCSSLKISVYESFLQSMH